MGGASELIFLSKTIPKIVKIFRPAAPKWGRRPENFCDFGYGFAEKNKLARSHHRKKMATELAPSAQKKFRPQKKQLARSETLKRAS